MSPKALKLILLVIFISAFFYPVGFQKNSFGALPNFLILAQEGQLSDPITERQQLEEELKKLEAELLKIDEDITKTEKEKKTLQNQIYILRKKIEKLELQIQQSNVMINDLGLQIEDTEASIKQTSLKIEDSRQKLANILQTIYEEDQKSLIEILASERTLSGFFDNLMALETLNTKSRELLENIKDLKSSLEVQEQSLDEEKTNLEKVVTIQTLQKKESESVKKDQDYFLKLTETQYQKQLKEKEETAKKAAEIRAKIYELIGIRKEVTYEEALEVAKYAASQLGIRPALLLGVLSQESAIGKNVGQCYVKNTSTGSGVVAYSGKAINNVMNPTRDIPHFLNIIKKLNSDKGLNLDPFETLVSCPMSFGWGGAMGPAQFIPSTWVLYEDRVKERTGNSADPWDLRDASLAASTYLKDGINKYGTEGKAVQAYFCGSPKNTYWCSWYEKNVLYLADCHQNFITSGSMSLKCQEAIGLK